MDRVRECRFIAVVGASGSGKSSLVRAGLIPAVRAGKIAGSESWPLVMFTPGPQPVQALAARLLSIVGGNRLLPELVALINAESDNLNQMIAGAMVDHPEDARFVIVIDQFEEVFTRASAVERERFLEALTTAANINGGRATVVITMRADYFDRLSEYPLLARLFEGFRSAHHGGDDRQ
ncbi:MAG: AAA family ATPase [Chloroflexi bacterium]|nr:AAA family ATPase [Chloroflexota bacterium]